MGLHPMVVTFMAAPAILITDTANPLLIRRMADSFEETSTN